jgi:DNA repair photolyase
LNGLSFRRIYVDAQVADLPIVERICGCFLAPVEIVKNEKTVYRAVSESEDPVSFGKQVLFLTQNKGRFVRGCPGTRHYTCCQYMILHIGAYCTMDCSYCILQTYFHPPVLQFFVNHADLFAGLGRLFSSGHHHRIGTGEFTDSLIWEPWTGLSRQIIRKFANQTRSVLELKTKTVAIDTLENLHHNRKTITAWSMNTPRIIKTEERNTASLAQRLAAAADSESWGYPLAFHFDPMVIYDGCIAEYLEVVDQIFSTVSPRNIVWISLGTFRFIPSLKSIIQYRFQASTIVYGEFIPGLDGKMRYFKPLRIALYRAMVERIRGHSPDVMVYFCMEDDEVWKKSTGFIPAERGGLPAMLDHSAKMICGLDD